MPGLPSHVTVGPHRITVRADADTGRLLREEDSRGDSRPDQLLIRLDTDRPHTAVAETLLHEVLHIVWNQTSMRSSEACRDIEEAAVQALTPWLLGVLRDNPELVAYLTDDRTA